VTSPPPCPRPPSTPVSPSALAGGWAIAKYSPSAVVLAGLLICALALPVAWATRTLTPPTADSADEAAPVERDVADRFNTPVPVQEA
jgi:hypothetical protein